MKNRRSQRGRLSGSEWRQSVRSERPCLPPKKSERVTLWRASQCERGLGAAQEVAGEEGYVGGAFGQTAHEVGEPVAAVGDVDAQAIAVFDETALQIGTHTVEHLELEIVLGDLVGGGEANCGGDHGGSVGGNSVVEGAGPE